MADEVRANTAPRWGVAAALFVVVSGAIFALAKTTPFKPDGGGANAASGDAARGETLFATSCAGCHGPAGTGGGVGPVLSGVPRDATTVAGVIASGRGVMPAGLVSGQDAADVAAYVVAIGGGQIGDSAGAGGDPSGTVTLTGPTLSGLSLRLNAPAPEGWSVWIEGPAGRQRLAAIPPGERTFTLRDVGEGSLVTGRERVVVGPAPDRPTLRGDISGLDELLVTSAAGPEGASLVDGADAQIALLREHIVFLRRALDERNLPNIKFHGEHMVNIARGNPTSDADGNGEPSNPGDGVGIVGQGGRDGYVPRIATVLGTDSASADPLVAEVEAIARLGEQCGAAQSVEAGRPCVTDIAARDRAVADLTTTLLAAARARTTVALRTVP